MFNTLNLSNFANFIEHRKEIGPVKDSNHIGAAFKDRRLKLKMTLEDVSKDICCLAYLSKLERNMVSGIDNGRIMRLCERLDIKYEAIENLNSDETIKQVLKYQLLGKSDAINNIVKEFNDNLYIASLELVKALNALNNKDYVLFNNIMTRIDKVKDTLNDFEVLFMLYIMIIYYISINQYYNANKYFGYSKEFDYQNINLKILFLECEFKISCVINTSQCSYIYNKLKEYYDYNYPLYRQYLMKLDYLKVVDKEVALIAIKDMENEYIFEECKNEFIYTKCLIFIKNDMYLDACKIIYNKTNKDHKILALFSFALKNMIDCNKYSKSDINYMKKVLLEMLKNATIEEEDHIHLGFIKLMQFEIDRDDNEVICNYIKNIYLKELQNYQIKLYIDYVVMRYVELMGKLSRYKDAYLFLKDIINNLKIYTI